MPAKDVVITGTFTPKTNTKYLVKYFGKNKNGADYLIEEVE
jgi:hypothetical protein